MLAGVPSVFVRLSGCNLRCVWCDTPYTSWLPEHKHQQVAQVAAQVRFFKCQHVVITGGEPMIQAPQLKVLVDELASDGKKITIETNGTIFDPNIRPFLWSVSPKLKNAEPVTPPRWRDAGDEWVGEELKKHRRNNKLDNLPRFLSAVGSEVQYKFVVQSRQDMDEIDAIIKEYRLPSARIVLMPEGITEEQLRQRSVMLAEICKERGYRFSSRVHVMIWGNRRGV